MNHPRTSAVDEILDYMREGGVADPQPDLDLSAVFHADAALSFERFVPPGSPLDMINLILWIEERFFFDVEIDDIELENFRTPAVLGAYIEHRRKR